MRFQKLFDSTRLRSSRLFAFLKAEILFPLRFFFSWEESGASQGVLEGRRWRSDVPSVNFKKILGPLKWALPVILIVALAILEMRTSALQSRLLVSWSKKMSFTIEPGQSSSILFPKAGPLDERLGYNRIPEFQQYMKNEGFSAHDQARFSAELALAARLGLTPPSREPTNAALLIRGAAGDPLYNAIPSEDFFGSYEQIPPLIVETLLFIENRELLGEPADYRANPAVDWGRLAKATLTYVGSKLGLPVKLQGGSTLATQMEKYRHSPQGRTQFATDKFRQMLSASLKAYHKSSDTRPARRQIILDYLNSVPLGAAPGFGEVNGLGSGLRAWFGISLLNACQQLSATVPSPLVFKQILALLYSARAPSCFLVQQRSELDAKVNSYLHLLSQAHVLDFEFAGEVEKASLNFLLQPSGQQEGISSPNKATNAIRNRLVRMLHVPGLYDLDRLHLEVESTIDTNLQTKASRLLQEMKDVNFLAAHGLLGEHLLSRGDPGNVNYSILIYENRPEGNLLRVQTDTFNGPFDINAGVKLQLGSTAKLRTLAHYLEVVTLLYEDMIRLDNDSLAERMRNARDPITRWAAQSIAGSNGIDLYSLLQMALDRTYSASPNETFFTGGGNHTFANYDKDDNRRILTIREAFIRSVNLVFIRLMRDLTLYHEARLPYDPVSVMRDQENPDRGRMLKQIAEKDGRRTLVNAYEDYHGLPLDAVIAQLLGQRSHSMRSLAILCFAWNPQSRLHPQQELSHWFASLGESISSNDIGKLARAFGNPRLNIADYGYLLDVDPLKLWCLGQLQHDPSVSLAALWDRSANSREIASRWLLKTTNRKAQDVRLQIQIEEDAFLQMTPHWQQLGFPFERLVPSLATAIGSSSDRPVALAELMGDIVNDGVRRPTYETKKLLFASGTPYQTTLEMTPVDGKQVMNAAVARTLREILALVVDKGTARRVAGSFIDPKGGPMIAGGKTGSGDNRFFVFGHGGLKISSTPVDRTATFVFYIGRQYYGIITAFVDGPQSGQYAFTSALPVSVLKLFAPTINSSLARPEPIIQARAMASESR
jgi:membrane peptidoglycan carboxypeptidase